MAAGPRRDGDTAPGMPDGKDPPGKDSCRQRSGPTRPGTGPARPGSARSRQGLPGRVGQSAEGRRSPGRVSFPPSLRGGCAATAAGPVLRGVHARLRGLPSASGFAQRMGETQTWEKPPRVEQQGQDPRSGPQKPVRSGPASEMEVPRHREAARPQKSGQIFTECHILRY